jgi:hypothetical protein
MTTKMMMQQCGGLLLRRAYYNKSEIGTFFRKAS